MRRLGVVVVMVCLLCAGGCLKFGSNVEVSGKKFDAAKLADVSAKTGVVFPPGTTGLHYKYIGDTIDPSLVAKVEIPNTEKAAFMANAIFSATNRPERVSGASSTWWQPNLLQDATLVTTANKNPLITVHVGQENGKTIAYLSWTTY